MFPCRWLERSPYEGFDKRGRFCSAVAACLDVSTRWPLWRPWRLAMAMPRLGNISARVALKVRQFAAIRFNILVVFSIISSAPSNLNADSMAPTRWSFQKHCWPSDQRPVIQIEGRSSAFHEALDCHERKRIAFAINGLRQLLFSAK